MKKIVLSILGLVYIVITVFITIFLLAHNDYNLAEIGDNTYFVMRRDNEKYNAGDLLLINHTNSNNIEANKDIFCIAFSCGRRGTATAVDEESN